MPYLNIETNQPKDADSSTALLHHLIRELSQSMGKPASIFMAKLSETQSPPVMVFGEDNAPCAFAELSGIALDASSTPELAAVITDSLAAGLGIPPGRIFVRFQDTERSHWGVGGQTLDQR